MLHVEVEGQLIRPSLLVTVPEPLPVLGSTVRANFCVKVAVPALTAAAGMVKEQAPVPVQVPPPHPVKTKPAEGVAVNVTVALELKFALQVAAVQLMPAGLLVTVPDPATVTLTPNAVVSKLAFTSCTAFIVTVQEPVPEQAPLQPVKVELGPGVALKVTEVPWL